jgi:hypothetical protein
MGSKVKKESGFFRMIAGSINIREEDCATIGPYREVEGEHMLRGLHINEAENIEVPGRDQTTSRAVRVNRAEGTNVRWQERAGLRCRDIHELGLLEG